MKKARFIFVLLILMLSFNYLFLSADSKKIKIIVDKANVYLEANENSSVVDTVKKGMVLNLFETGVEKGEWYYVFYYSEEKSSNLSGFVKTSMAEIIVDEMESKQELGKKEAEKEKKEKERGQEMKQEEVEEFAKTKQIKHETIEETTTKKTKKNGLKLGIGINAGYSMPSTSEYAGGINFGGNIYLLISKNFGVELSGLYFESDVAEDPNALSSGKLSIKTLSISLQGRLPVSDLLTPYIIAGGSYFLNSFSLDSTILNSWDALGFDVKEEVENGLGFNVGAGLDLSVSKNFMIGIEGRYFINKQEGSWEIADQLSDIKTSGSLGKLDMNNLYLGIAIKYLFSL